MKYKTQFTHTLISPVDYATGGEAAKAVAVMVPAPCALQITALAQLEQEQAKAMFRAATALKDMVKKSEEKEPSEDISDADAEGHVQMLAGNGFDLAAGYAQMKTLLAFPRNPAKMDGKEKMTEDLFSMLSVPDMRIMLGKYLLNFLVFSRQG